jgi:hypothetical protein
MMGRPAAESKVLTHCQRCGTPRWQFPSRIRPYCNRTCFTGSHRVAPLMVPCEYCGTPFKAWQFKRDKGHDRFCSIPCANAFDRERHTVDCLNCGKPVHALPSKQAKGHSIYCSIPCRVAFEALQQYYAFWSHVDMSGGPDACWPWKLSCFDSGYGQYYYDHKNRRAHREAFERTWGPLPEKHGALHHCDNKPCCNPYHLFPGTTLINNQDRTRKGRSFAHIPDAQAREIFESRGTNSATVLAEHYHVSNVAIYNIWTKRTHKHIHK